MQAEEVERRLVHACGALWPLLYVFDLVSYAQLQYVLLASSALAVAVDLLRLSGVVNWRLFDRLTREYEEDGLAGYVLYLLSMTFVAWVFAPNAAIPGMLMLSFADPVSGLLGSGELQQVKQGFVLLATFAVSTLIALLFVPSVPAILGGIAAALADGVKPVIRGYVVDDNLTIPPAAAAAITVGLWLLSVSP